MPTVPIYTSRSNTQGQKHGSDPNPLPDLLQTPAGLAILELQGTINLPSQETNIPNDGEESIGAENKSQLSTEYETPIGRLVFSGYTPSTKPGDTTWMKRMHLYVGRHQRFTGEVKKLPVPLAVIQRRQPGSQSVGVNDTNKLNDGGDDYDYRLLDRGDELEIVEIVKYKIIFSSRPEPVRDEEE